MRDGLGSINNLGLALVIALKLYTSVAKGLKLKVRKFCVLIPMFVEVTGEKLVGGPSRIGLIVDIDKSRVFLIIVMKQILKLKCGGTLS